MEGTLKTPLAGMDEFEKMRRETDVILKKSAALIKEMEELMEAGRQLRAAQATLMERREKNKKI
jgi:hypothetical protein